MGEKKLKVVWLCYFTNQFIQDRIKPCIRIGEIASWIPKMIKLFENDNNVEIHVVSQHRWIGGYKSFKHNGVTYHFFNPGIPYIGRHWPGFFRFDHWTNFLQTKIQVAQVIKKIAPDIIHMHGVENEFCVAIKQFYEKYPVFITIQGFIHKTSVKSKGANIRVQNELSILKLFNHYGYRTETMGEEIKVLNNKAVLSWHNYPGLKIDPIKSDKKFDLVFFARVCKDKGIEDLLQAVSIIKKEKMDISLCIIGGGKLKPWKDKAKELNIDENVIWAGFLPTQKDVYELAAKARISVLPTYHDIIPATIVESMFLQLPVIAYNVGSIHEINKKERIIILVDKFNIMGLVKSILLLLNDIDLREKIAEKGYKIANEMFNTDNYEIKTDILHAYAITIKDFQKS